MALFNVLQTFKSTDKKRLKNLVKPITCCSWRPWLSPTSLRTWPPSAAATARLWWSRSGPNPANTWTRCGSSWPARRRRPWSRRRRRSSFRAWRSRAARTSVGCPEGRPWPAPRTRPPWGTWTRSPALSKIKWIFWFKSFDTRVLLHN